MPMLVEQVRASFPGHQGGGQGCSRHRSIRAIGRDRVLSAQGWKPFASAVFPDGALHQSDVTGKRMAARAQADVMRFNVPAAGCWIKQGDWPGLFRYSD